MKRIILLWGVDGEAPHARASILVVSALLLTTGATLLLPASAAIPTPTCVGWSVNTRPDCKVCVHENGDDACPGMWDCKMLVPPSWVCIPQEPAGE